MEGIFPENFTSLNNVSEMLKINIKKNSRKTYLRSKLLNQTNNFAEI